MAKIVLEKTKDFRVVEPKTKKSLEGIFEQEFKTFQALLTELYDKRKLSPGICFPLVENHVKINILPFTIKEWPLYYKHSSYWGDVWEIAKIIYKD